MRRSIEILLGEEDAKLGGYAGMLNYRYMNLCIKAEPVALLSITVSDIEGNEYNLEDVADAMVPDDFTFEIVPHEMETLPFIQAGFAQTHPEFRQQVIVPKDEDRFFQSDSSEYETERHLVCTMPEVDNERHDFLKEAVKTLYDQCMTEVDKVNAHYSDMLADRTKDLPEKEGDEAKEKMEKLMDMYIKTIDAYRDNKVQEIEESYQRWIAQQVESKLEGIQNKDNNN